MYKILVIICVFTLNTSGQQMFLSKVNQNEKKVENGPKLYLSRVNPMYREHQISDQYESEDNYEDEDIEELYNKEVLGLDTQSRQNGFNSRTPVPRHGKHPIHMSEKSPLYRYFKNIQPESHKNNHHQESVSELPIGDFVLKKHSPTISENGTFILGGYKFENTNFPKANIKSYKIEDQNPIVTRISTIKFNGETVSKEFLQNYFKNTFFNDAETSANTPIRFQSQFVKPDKEDHVNKDGFGLIDVRSSFNTEPKLSVLRRRGLKLKNATSY